MTKSKEEIATYQKAYRQRPEHKSKERDRSRTRYAKNPDSQRKKKEKLSPSGKYSRYKSKAKKRDIQFNLTFDEFMSFWRVPCSYCNTDIETIGLDRIDSSIGYEYADNFSAQWGDKGERTSNSRVIKAYLRIENPYETDDWSDTEPSKDNPDWMQKLIDQGYDGIHFVEHSAFGTETEWVAFYPEQIRIIE